MVPAQLDNSNFRGFNTSNTFYDKSFKDGIYLIKQTVFGHLDI